MVTKNVDILELATLLEGAGLLNKILECENQKFILLWCFEAVFLDNLLSCETTGASTTFGAKKRGQSTSNYVKISLL